MTYQNASVLITGASRGIGRSIALSFAAQTNRQLILLARGIEGLEETKKLALAAGASGCTLIACDATDEQDILNVKLPADVPTPGILVNNAGSYLYKKATETTDQEFRQQIDLNLFTSVNVTRRFLPDLLALDRSLIVNICSVGALHGLPESGAYSAAKHALLGYTRSLRAELLQTNVGVTAINLGQTHSPSWDESAMSPDELINPTDVANLLVVLSSFSPRTLAEEVLLQPQHGRVDPM
ncbi:MAG: SDR family NAD(P)-dependent oxidoreductase [Balneolaceae bacterium]